MTGKDKRRRLGDSLSEVAQEAPEKRSRKSGAAGLHFIESGEGENAVTDKPSNIPLNGLDTEIRECDPADVRLWKHHNRMQKLLSAESIQELAEDIKASGQKHPALGRRVKQDGEYVIELIYGARRLAACRQAGVKLLVQLCNLDDDKALEFMEAENAARKDISAYEAGHHYQSLLDQGLYKDVASLCETLKLKRRNVDRAITVAQVPLDLVECIGDPHKIPVTKLEKLAGNIQSDNDSVKAMISTCKKVKKEAMKDDDGRLVDKFGRVVDEAFIIRILLGEIEDPEIAVKSKQKAARKAATRPKPRNFYVEGLKKPVAMLAGEPGKSAVRITLPKNKHQEEILAKIVQLLEQK